MPGKPGRGQPNALDKLDPVTRDKCINLLLSGKLGVVSEVAKIAGVTRQAILKYKQRHLRKAVAIAEELEQARAATGTEVAKYLPILAQREKRLEALQDRHNRLMIVVNERAEDLATAPGGKSGFLVRQLKQVGSGKDAQLVEEYKVDTGLLSEFREHEKQMAIELGQWSDHAGNTSLNLVQVIMSPKERDDSDVIDLEPQPNE